MKKRALISVSDKQGIEMLARELIKQNYEIISTGGTAKHLIQSGIDIVEIEEITHFPEILDGRVKTLHPKIHGGLLAKEEPEHERELLKHQIEKIDFVVVNLYPFQETVKKRDVTKEEIIENIDIGGPALLRASAKNYERVTVVVDPKDYGLIIEKLNNRDVIPLDLRRKFAAKVFQHTAQYDAVIANYFNEQIGERFPGKYTITYEKVKQLRYGENPHQEAAFYKKPHEESGSLVQAKQLHGKDLSYNNIQDVNAAIEMITEHEQPAAVAVKHMNPCGIALGETIEEAFDKVYEADPISIFGGIVALNEEVTETLAKKLEKIFLEIIIAPKFSKKALSLLKKKKNLRLLQISLEKKKNHAVSHVSVKGGLLVQSMDQYELAKEDLKVVTKIKPTERQISDLLFAQRAVKHVKSNAIVLAKNHQTIGIGAGQMNRVGAAKIAIEQAGTRAEGSVLASDAFFPMPDTVHEAVKAGVKAIIQPGGSKRDQESIEVCNQHGIAMVFTEVRHFKH